MIQKRYKQTEALAQAQGLKALIESQEVVLAKIELPEITINGVIHDQILKVRNVNVAIAVDFIKISPERVLINQETQKELKGMNLYVPDWTITDENLSSHIGEDGQRIMYEMEYYDDETGEVITEQVVIQDILDEEGNPILDENGLPTTEDVVEELEPLADEAFMMPTIPYLMLFVGQMLLPDLILTFSHQYVDDNVDVWTVISNPTLERP